MVNTSPDNTAYLDDAIEQRIKSGPASAEKISNDVVRKVEEQTEWMRKSTNAEISSLAEEEMQAAQSWQQTVDSIYAGFTVDELVKKEGADGMVTMENKERFIDEHFLRTNADHGHGERVVAHENVHAEDQASTYDMQEIYLDPTNESSEVVTVTTMAEGQAIEGAGQPNAELVDSYQEHRAKYKELLSTVGDSALVERAMKSGNISEIQKRIIEKQGVPEFSRN